MKFVVNIGYPCSKIHTLSYVPFTVIPDSDFHGAKVFIEMAYLFLIS